MLFYSKNIKTFWLNVLQSRDYLLLHPVISTNKNTSIGKQHNSIVNYSDFEKPRGLVVRWLPLVPLAGVRFLNKLEFFSKSFVFLFFRVRVWVRFIKFNGISDLK